MDRTIDLQLQWIDCVNGRIDVRTKLNRVLEQDQYIDVTVLGRTTTRVRSEEHDPSKTRSERAFESSPEAAAKAVEFHCLASIGSMRPDGSSARRERLPSAGLVAPHEPNDHAELFDALNWQRLQAGLPARAIEPLR